MSTFPIANVVLTRCPLPLALPERELLHDAELGTGPAAVLLVLDPAVGKEFRRAVLEVDLVHHLAQFSCGLWTPSAPARP